MIERTARRVFAALALAWAAAIFWASSLSDPFPFVPSGIFSHDKLLHAAAYSVLAGLAAAALAWTRLGPVRGAIVAAFLAAAYGASDEWHQSYVPGRQADAADLAADAVGAIAGASAAAGLLRGRVARTSIGPS
jgi:VanZ family protein